MEHENLKSFVKEFKNGDYSNFNTFYEITKKSVFYNILSFVKSYEVSEEILQNTFVKFLSSIKDLKYHSPILGLLITISKNLSLDYLKKIKEDEIEDNTLIKDESNEKELSNNILDSMLLLDRLKKVLKEKEYEVILFHIYDELTFEEIAKLTSSPLGTILYRYNIAIKKAKEVLINETY